MEMAEQQPGEAPGQQPGAMPGMGPREGDGSLLAFLPGGQAEITVLAIVAGVDAAFVVAHHVFRMVLVILGAPVAMRLLDRWEK